jgi:hypothetical protein
MVHYAAGHCARARGELSEAQSAIERGLDLARRGGLRLDTVYGLLALAELAGADRDRLRARDLHQRAERQLAACTDPGRTATASLQHHRTRPRGGLHAAGPWLTIYRSVSSPSCG